jgi:hypothetical protein
LRRIAGEETERGRKGKGRGEGKAEVEAEAEAEGAAVRAVCMREAARGLFGGSTWVVSGLSLAMSGATVAALGRGSTTMFAAGAVLASGCMLGVRLIVFPARARASACTVLIPWLMSPRPRKGSSGTSTAHAASAARLIIRLEMTGGRGRKTSRMLS